MISELRRGTCWRCGDVADVVPVRTVDGTQRWCARCTDVDAASWPAWAKLLFVLGLAFLVVLVAALAQNGPAETPGRSGTR